jgi:hypothetical protein
MGKRGRPRKAGARYADGKLKRPTREQMRAIEGDRYRENMQQAANQPHRRWAANPLDQRLESALGRFCAFYGLRGELFDAGRAWGDVYRRWRAANCIPDPLHSSALGGGAGPSEATVAGWWRDIQRVETALRGHGSIAFLAARSLCLDDADISPEAKDDAIVALTVVAVEMGRLPRRGGPFERVLDSVA